MLLAAQPSTPGPLTADGNCQVEQNANYNGTAVANVSTTTAAACATQCQQFSGTALALQPPPSSLGSDLAAEALNATAGCNIFVWCPESGGCDNGAGILVPADVCVLKTQVLGATVNVWSRGPSTSFTSGACYPGVRPSLYLFHSIPIPNSGSGRTLGAHVATA